MGEVTEEVVAHLLVLVVQVVAVMVERPALLAQAILQLLLQAKAITVVLEQDLERYTKKVARLTPDALVRELHVHYSGGEGMVAALQTNLALARRFGDEQVWVPGGDFQRELVMDLMTGSPLANTFQEEVVQAEEEQVLI
jgi:hypothetical protein